MIQTPQRRHESCGMNSLTMAGCGDHQLDSAGGSARSSRSISTMAGGTSPGSWKGFARVTDEKRTCDREKLTPLEPARIMTHLTGTFGRASMKDKTVAILESRMGDHIASLVRKYGGTPFSAPALAEIPDVDPAHIDELIRDWNSAPPDIFIFQTGVGTRALFSRSVSLKRARYAGKRSCHGRSCSRAKRLWRTRWISTPWRARSSLPEATSRISRSPPHSFGECGYGLGGALNPSFNSLQCAFGGPWQLPIGFFSTGPTRVARPKTSLTFLDGMTSSVALIWSPLTARKHLPLKKTIELLSATRAG
jgi:hypothetical protein